MPGLALTNATLVRSGMIKSCEVACARHLFGVPAQDGLGGPSEMGVCSRVSSRRESVGTVTYQHFWMSVRMCLTSGCWRPAAR